MNKQWILAGAIAVVLVIAGVIVYASNNGGHLPNWVPGQSYHANVEIEVTRSLTYQSSFNVKIKSVSPYYGMSILSGTQPLILEADVKIYLASYDKNGLLIDSQAKLVTLGLPLIGSTVEHYTMNVGLGNNLLGKGCTIKAILYEPQGTRILSQDSWVIQ